jgi:hypothetical protein
MTKKRLIDQRGYFTEYGIPVETQEKQRRRGEGPPSLQIGGKYYYVREELDRWLQDQHIQTAAPAAGAPAPKVPLTLGDDSLAQTLAEIIKTAPTSEEIRIRVAELLGVDERLFDGGADDAA